MDKDVEENKTLQISSQQKIINSKEVEILGIKIDQKYHFNKTKCIIENFPIH